MRFITLLKKFLQIKILLMNDANCCSPTNSTNHTQTKKNLEQIRPWLYRPKKSTFGTRRAYKYNDQHWTIQQNQKYIEFLTQYLELFKSDSNQKRKYHLNRMVSKFVGTRSPIQCRSHHQRMLKSYGNLQSIIRQLNKESEGEAQVEKLAQTHEIEEAELSHPHSESEAGLSDLPLISTTKQIPFEVTLEFLDSQEIIFNNFFDL